MKTKATEVEKVSIIVPVYNVEKYLDRCVISLVEQTYQNLEIILVDDGSPDRCPQMCDEWAEKDERIRVIHKENAGLGMARNTGIDNAAGEYICFFDSDDYVAIDIIEQALLLARAHNADLVLLGFSTVGDSGQIVEEATIVTEKSLYVGDEVRNVLLPALLGPNPETGDTVGLPMSACGALFSMNMIRRSGWRFVSEREIISEDIYSMLELYRSVERVAILQKSPYFYCYNGVSLSRSYRADRYEKQKHCYLKCLELAEKCGYTDTVKYRCASPFLSGVFAALKSEVLHCRNYRSARNALQTIVQDDVLQKVLRDHRRDRMNRKKRIFFWCVRYKLIFPCYILLKAKLKTGI